jgi:5-(carboxyamino)imidazole ribonucleotide synthase
MSVAGPGTQPDTQQGAGAGLEPGAWLGVLGGGQLGAMFAIAAKKLGYKVAAVDADASCMASRFADRFIHAKPDSAEAIAALTKQCAAVTVETENIAPETLIALSKNMRTRPAANVLAVAQDRIAEKGFITSLGLLTAPYIAITEAAHCSGANIAALLPGILKTARQGYDGKGQATVRSEAELLAAWQAAGSVPCVLEKRVALELEVSVVLGRDAQGNVMPWPVSENGHVDGILDRSVVPARVDEQIAQQAREAAARIANALDYQGVLCVEFFVVAAGSAGTSSQSRLLVNEMAPRPHNSGHYTIEACATSQFAQQARILAGLPLGSTAMQGAAVMQNLVGGRYNPERLPAPADAAKGVHLHLYGKAEIRKGRKMGHITCVAADQGAAIALAEGLATMQGVSH